jgi:hypothetical protein
MRDVKYSAYRGLVVVALVRFFFFTLSLAYVVFLEQGWMKE